MLFGLIGGGVPGTVGGRDRLTAILGAVYLVAILLMWVVPQLFTRYAVPAGVAEVVRYALPVLLLIMLAIPRSTQQRSDPVIVDLFYSLMLFLLVVALALGSFVIQEVAHGQYLLALAQALMVIALLLAGMSWLWNPRAGFSVLARCCPATCSVSGCLSNCACGGWPNLRRPRRDRSSSFAMP